MLIDVVYSDENGVSHFGSVEYELFDNGSIGSISNVVEVNKVMFRTTPAGYDYPWHVTPRRQFVFVLDGAVVIEVGDGEKRQYNDGDVFLLLDTTGDGHNSHDPIDVVRYSSFLGVSDNQTFDIIK